MQGRLYREIVDRNDTTVVLRNTLSDEALDALGGVDWERVTGDYLDWDEDLHEWRDNVKRL